MRRESTEGHDRLVALVSTDVKSSTAVTYTNEISVLQDIKADRLAMEKFCQFYGGRVWASLGDGLILSFNTAVQALMCAVQFQHYTSEQRKLRGSSRGICHRIGIHLGEFNSKRGLNNQVVLIGDKLQHQAEPGGICCSRSVYDALQLKHDLPMAGGALYTLEGLEQPFKLYHYPEKRVAQFKLIQEKLQRLSFNLKAVELVAVVFTAIDDYETELIKHPQAIHRQIDHDFQIMRHRSLNYNARWIKSIGGGSLWVFDSAIQAVEWAMKVQRSLQRNRQGDQTPHHRIAIHLGDIIWNDNDIAGTTVNWAARLLAHTPSGGIGLSSAVYDAIFPILSLKQYTVSSLLVSLKGLPHPCRIHTLESRLNLSTALNPVFEPVDQTRSSQDSYADAQAVQFAYQNGLREFTEQDFQRFQFQGMSLASANFSCSVLKDIDGEKLNAPGANFSRSQLTNANLTQANLAGSYFNYADLENANLKASNLQQAHLSNANLRGVNLQGANLKGAKVTDLQLSMAICDAATCYPDGRFRHQKWDLWQRLWPGQSSTR